MNKKEYLKNNYKSFTLRLNVASDDSIIERLDAVPNMTRYIVDLVREDIERAARYQQHVPGRVTITDRIRYPYEVIDQIRAGIYYTVGYARDLEDAKLLMINYVQRYHNVGMLSIVHRTYDSHLNAVCGRIDR